MSARYRSYHWNVIEVGTLPSGEVDLVSLNQAIDQAKNQNVAPTLIRLKTVIAWPAPKLQGTSKSHGSALGAEEVAATNRALQTNAYKNVLLGLKARFDQQVPAKPQEPKALDNRVNPSQVPQSIQVFKNLAEQQAALRDPRFRVDPNYRKAVEAMVVNSSNFGFRNR